MMAIFEKKRFNHRQRNMKKLKIAAAVDMIAFLHTHIYKHAHTHIYAHFYDTSIRHLSTDKCIHIYIINKCFNNINNDSDKSPRDLWRHVTQTPVRNHQLTLV